MLRISYHPCTILLGLDGYAAQGAHGLLSLHTSYVGSSITPDLLTGADVVCGSEHDVRHVTILLSRSHLVQTQCVPDGVVMLLIFLTLTQHLKECQYLIPSSISNEVLKCNKFQYY